MRNMKSGRLTVLQNNTGTYVPVVMSVYRVAFVLSVIWITFPAAQNTIAHAVHSAIDTHIVWRVDESRTCALDMATQIAQGRAQIDAIQT